MQTITETRTLEVLAGMFTENTGQHLLDSGGAYGRNYEKHAGKTWRDFMSAPYLRVETDYLTLNTFHYLADRLTYSPGMDAAFQEYSQTSDGYHLEDMETWPETLGATEVYTCNTYNGESALDQTLQFTAFDLNGSAYVILQVHGGCDVRGGYTRPRVFMTSDYFLLFDFERVSATCSDNCGFTVDFCQSRIEMSNCGDSCSMSCGNVDNLIPNDTPPRYGREWRVSDGCPCCGAALA